MYSEQKQALAAELNFKHPAVLAVSGAKGCGKTTLLAALLFAAAWQLIRNKEV